MKEPVTILAFAGSARKASVNKRLIATAAGVAEQQGAKVTLVDLADFPASLYNGDDEERDGIPVPMREMKALLASHDAFLIASPEYNGGVPPLLINVFSWASRPEGKEAPKSVFKEKPVAILTASPGGLGGRRAATRLREALTDLDCIPVPGSVSLPRAHQAFDSQGSLISTQTLDSIADLTARLIEFAGSDTDRGQR